MKTYQYKGFEVLKSEDGRTIMARRHYPATVHRGYPMPWKTVVENSPSAGQASKALEDYIAPRRLI